MRTWSLSCIAMALVVGGCERANQGDNQDMAAGNGDGSMSTVTAMQACADEANLRCNMINQCQPGLGGVGHHYPDLMTCVSRQTESCVNALAAPGTGQTPEHVESCVAAKKAQSCTEFFSGVAPAECLTPAGSLQIGAACAVSGQCASAFCSVAANASCGSCAAAPTVGTPCKTEAACGDTLGCSAAGQCATPMTVGGSCDDQHPCIAGSVVCATLKDDGGIGRTCQLEVQTAGDECDANNLGAPDCDLGYGLVCIAKKCVAATAATAGSVCGADATNKSFAECVGGATCEGPMAQRKCVAPAMDGQACSTIAGPHCLDPANCVVGSGGDAGTASSCELIMPAECS